MIPLILPDIVNELLFAVIKIISIAHDLPVVKPFLVLEAGCLDKLIARIIVAHESLKLQTFFGLEVNWVLDLVVGLIFPKGA